MSSRVLAVPAALLLVFAATAAPAQGRRVAGSAQAAQAGDAAQPAVVPEPPPLPKKLQSGQSIEPEVTIRQGSKQTIYEYRIHGQLRAIKVVPVVGPPYYLIDANGTGHLDTRVDHLGPDFLINGWVLFSW